MKKVLAILLALSVLALSACAAKQTNSDTQKDSNTAETEQQPDSAQTAETQQPAQEAKRIEPLAESLDLNALTDATVAASFGAEDISEKDGKTVNSAKMLNSGDEFTLRFSDGEIKAKATGE